MAKYAFIFILSIWATESVQSQSFVNTRPVPDVESTIVITSIAIDKENNKFVGTDEGLLRIGNNGIVENILGGVRVQSLAWHTREGLWAAINGNVLIHPESGKRIVVGEDQTLIRSLAMSGSQLWVGTNEGVYVVSLKRSEITDHFTTSNSKLVSASVNVVYVDDSGIKWVGTDKGVARVVNDKWKLYEKTARVTAITGNVEGVWVAGQNEMWLVDQYNRWAPTGVGDGLSKGDVRALAADKKGKIYVLSEIFVQFDPYTDAVIELENQYAANPKAQVALLCDLDDNLWLGSLDHGLVTMELEVPDQLPLEAFVNVTHPKCYNDENGVIAIYAEGGAPPYSYKWANQGITGRAPDQLAAGTYNLTVTDAGQNQFVLDVRLENPLPVSVQIEEVQAITNAGAADGILRAKVQGGTGDISYSWTIGDERTLRNVSAGSHSVLVTDSEGCTAQAQYALAEGPPVAEPQPDEVAEIVAIEDTTASAAEKVVSPDEDVVQKEEIVPEAPEPEKAIDAVDTDVLKTLDAGVLALGQTLRIEQLFFDADSTDVRPESFAVLDEIYAFLNNNQRIAIEIGGHTNGLPDHIYCDRLSEARARSVAEYLYQRGIPQTRIVYKGYGKRNPIATNETTIGRRKNQRVEIKILQI